MKKLLVFVLLGILITSCSIDDDNSNIEYDFAPITGSEFPEFFEAGKSYELTLAYQLPSTCHTFLGFDGGREDLSSQVFFIYALTSRDLNETNCDTEDPNLTSEGKIRNFMISANISDDEVFTFKLWKGKDNNGDPIFDTIEVPVGEPEVEQP